MKKLIIVLVTLLFSQYAIAKKECPPDKILNIQIEGTKVIYFQSGIWRTLGYLGDVGIEQRISLLLAAQMANKNVVVGYSRSDYNCNTPNYNERAILVRSYN